MAFDFDSIDTNQGLSLVVVERDPPILEKRLMRPAGSPAVDWPEADWDPRLQFPPSAWSYVSDSDPRDPIEGEFAQDANEAWKWVQNRVQLYMAKRNTPLFVWLTWEPPHCTGRGQGHKTDHEVREFTFGQMAARYGYQLHYHGRVLDKEICDG